ncbi:hypothetical protein BDN71DRAFT_650155 [Pleurotus eryngii]|uniref:Uncharacterized protein n=1 Tax=Pleurotus eryngii TaxID=5323 RepID=A0A9P5ZH74_PLEER|nr:hypothetical protein BDN71DRAFT_650155 [Pleurotus eryngii]
MSMMQHQILYVIIIVMVIVDVQIVIARMSLIARDVALQGGRDTTAAVAEGIPRLLSASVALWDKTIIERRE